MHHRAPLRIEGCRLFGDHQSGGGNGHGGTKPCPDHRMGGGGGGKIIAPDRSIPERLEQGRNGMKIRELLSPNFDRRAAGTKPTILVLHYTGTATGSEAEAVYLDPNPPPEKSKGPVSPHYMIDRDGAMTQFVREQDRAWHAGRSWWDG